MSTFVLSGSGNQALSAGVTALHVTITTLPPGFDSGTANPTNYYHVAMLRFGDGTGFWAALPVSGGPQWFGVPAGTTVLGYAVQPSGVITVVEVIGGTSPLGGATPSLEQLTDVNVAAIADTQILAWDAASGKWINVPKPTSGVSAVLASTTLTAAAASLTLAAIPQTATTLIIEFHIRTVDVATQVVLDIELNGDSNVAHYSGNNAAQRISVVASANDVANHFTDGRLNIPRYSDATLAAKACSCECRRPDSNWEWDNVIWTPAAPAAVTQVRLFATGNIVANSFAIAFGG